MALCQTLSQCFFTFYDSFKDDCLVFPPEISEHRHSALDQGSAISDIASCALCHLIQPSAAAGAVWLPVKQVCLYVLHLKHPLSVYDLSQSTNL